MSNDRVIELLWQMREAQVKARGSAVMARDLAALRLAQSDVEMIDRALSDETRLQKDWVASEAARLANPKPHADDGGWGDATPPEPFVL